MNMGYLLGKNSARLCCLFFCISRAIMIGCSSGQDLEVTFSNISCGFYNLSTEITFRRVFKGVVFAQGNYFNPVCKISAPDGGTKNMLFFLTLPNCGNHVREVNGEIYVSNNIVVQNHPFVQSDTDVVHKISCKLNVADMMHMQEFIHENHPTHFSTDDLEAYMDLQIGQNILGFDISNKLVVGDEVTMAIHVRDDKKHKDFRIQTCWAFEGETIDTSQYVVKIHDMYICKDDWMSNLSLSKDVDNVSDFILYGTLKAFKFPTSNNLHLTCSIVACTETCYKYCDKELDLIKRSKRSTNAMDNSYRERHRLMKATIKVLGMKLMQKNRELSENDVNFGRRSAIIVPTTWDDYAVTNHRPVDLVRNEISTFNLSNNVVVFTGNESDSKQEYCKNPIDVPTDGIPKLRFAIVTTSLSFTIFCLIMICIGLMLYIRKERKRHRIDSFFLYNLY